MNNSYEKLIIKNYNMEVHLDYVFEQLPLWIILTEAQKFKVVTYDIDGEPDNPFHYGKHIVVVRTILDTGTYKIEIHLEDEIEGVNIKRELLC